MKKLLVLSLGLLTLVPSAFAMEGKKPLVLSVPKVTIAAGLMGAGLGMIAQPRNLIDGADKLLRKK